jgi:hypothetical protein
LDNNIHFEFEYDDKGDLLKITVYDPNDIYDTSNYTILPNEVGKGKNYFNFEWKGFEYYQKAEPILPG